jgi:hypothetical protein
MWIIDFRLGCFFSQTMFLVMLNNLRIGGHTVPPRSFHTNINYFRGTVKKNKILRVEVQNVKQTKLINYTV